MCRKPIGHGLFLRCLLGDAGGDACVGIGLDFLLRMTGFVIPGGMQWSVGIFPLFSQCDPAGRRPAMCGRKRMIIIAHSAQLSPHCTGGGIRSDGGSSARSGRENDGQQASAEAACGLCRAATVEAVQSFASQQRSLLCPLSEHNRITGMTGHQDNPGTGYTLLGDEAPMLSVEKIFTAMGFAPVLTVDPQDLTAMKETVDRAVAALERGEHPAIVTRRPCLLIKRDRFQKGMCHVEPDKCRSCRSCLKVGCPAVSMEEGKAVIDRTQCVGCTVCAQVCPFGAIVKEEV